MHQETPVAALIVPDRLQLIQRNLHNTTSRNSCVAKHRAPRVHHVSFRSPSINSTQFAHHEVEEQLHRLTPYFKKKKKRATLLR